METQIFLIGDQTYDLSRDFNRLLQYDGDVILRDFLSKTFDRLRSESFKLRSIDRGRIQRFSTWSDLLALRAKGELPASLDQALACTYQIAAFIRQCGETDGVYPQPHNCYFIGLCTGALASSAICCARTLTELVPIAVETVVVAFHTGLCAADVGTRVEINDSTSPSWSCGYSGLSYEKAKTAIDTFSQAHELATSSRPCVSASFEQNVTITGPPSTLGSLSSSEEFSHLRSSTLPLFAPYHAPHLFSRQDVDNIMDQVSGTPYASKPAYLPIFSGSSGNFIWAANFRGLVEAALLDILLEPLRWDNVHSRISTLLHTEQDSKLVIKPISTNLGRSLMRALRSTGKVDAHIQESALGNDTSGTQEYPNPEERRSHISDTPTGGMERSKIAIVGMSGRFPGAEDADAFWDLLYQGLDVHRVVPARSWDVKTHVDPTLKKKNTMATPYGCWLDHPELWDNKFFNISPREAPQIDPAQRIALMTTYEAIEQAGIVPDGSPSTQKDRVGIFYGCTSQDWMETNSAQNIDTYLIPGGNRAFIPGRINYFFKFSGPSLSIDTACSSSLAAIHTACLSLWRGDSDTAIAGGTNVLTNPDFSAGLDRGHFLSRTGNCKTFDDEADGYCRGEGIGTVILKRYEDAVAEDDPILGVILGAYTNHSAEAESITRPHVGAQRDIFKKILASRGTDPSEISYIEMHGTGTQAGDASEMSSVLDTFAPSVGSRSVNQKLYLGSAKANIGHGESVSGVCSLAKVLLMMRNNIIPPHVGIKKSINRKFPTNLSERQVFIAKDPVPWNRPEHGARKVFINNFSAAGGNTALLLEDAPKVIRKRKADPRSTHPVAVSARCASSLHRNVAALITRLNGLEEDDNILAQLSYTTTARRMHHAHRVIVNATSRVDLKEKLQLAFDQKQGATRPKSTPQALFSFTGQGCQYPGMGKQLFEHFSSFRQDILRYDQIAQQQEFPSFVSLISSNDGSIDDYTPLVVQLANVCLEMALFRFWKSLGVTPAAVVGHSLGEFAALNAAKVLSESDTIFLVGCRARLMQDWCSRSTHAMLSVRSSAKDIKFILKDAHYEISCINSPLDTVLCGKNSNISAIQKTLSSKNVKSTLLKVPYAFHSNQVDPLLKQFETSARAISFNKPDIPVLCPLTGSTVQEIGVFNASYVARHCREQVNMLAALQDAKSNGVLKDNQLVLEIGPHPVVTNMITNTLGSQVKSYTCLQRGRDMWSTMTEAVAAFYSRGTDINWKEYHRDFKSSHRVLSLPAYSWELSPFWMQYVHDWSLRKGDAPGNGPSQTSTDAAEAVVRARKTKEPMKHPLESTTIHKIVEETITDRGGKLIVEADIARSDLNPFVQGHRVNDVPLCTPSVYADMALAIGTYLLDHYKPQIRERLVDVTEMVLERALVAKPQAQQLIRASGLIDWAEKSVACEFLSVDSSGKTIGRHSQCVIRFRDPSSKTDFVANSEQQRHRIDGLYNDLASCKTFRFSKNMVYRAVSSLAQFDDDYQAIKEIVLDNENMEATTVVDLSSVKKGGDFHTHPAYIDGLSQGGGFVMNCNDKSNLDVDIFVNHGWRSFQLFEKISCSEKYVTHVKMHPTVDKMWEGDVTIFLDKRLVARFGGIILQGVPRRLMNMILRQEMGSRASEKPLVNIPPKDAAIESKAVAPIAASIAPTQLHEPITKDAKGTTSKPQVFTKVIQIISEESGLALDELSDSMNFSEIGIDSLLSMIITGRMKEELDIDLEGTEFLGLDTINSLKEWLSTTAGDAAPDSTAETHNRPTLNLPKQFNDVVAPEKVSESRSSQVAQLNPSTSTLPETNATPVASDEAFTPILKIISEESGVAIEEITNDTSLSAMGVDSLLSMLIAGRMEEELSLEIESHLILTTSPTVSALKQSLAPILGVTLEQTPELPRLTSRTPSLASTSDERESSSGISTPMTGQSEDELPVSQEQKTPAPYTRPPPPAKARPASSVLLQGRPRPGARTLFLFPDGSGSAASYTHISRVAEGWTLIGLNCPYVRQPEEMTCTLDQLITSYLEEIRKRQPVGPYSFGGWSAGGILAYRAAQQVIREGDECENLLLIDSPAPKGLDKLPQRFMDHCEKIGVWSHAMPGSDVKPPPKTMVPHFNATMDILHDYYADPIPTCCVPNVAIIWAAESVMDGVNAPKLPPGDDDVEDMKFLSETRTDFSPGAWSPLFPGCEIEVDTAKGANHFSMMQGAYGQKLAEWVKKALL